MKGECLHRTLFLQFLPLSLFVFSCIAFNLDSHSPVLFTRKDASQNSTFFGFSHALYRDKGQSWLIVGAPRTSGNTESERYAGRIYRCHLKDGIGTQNACSPLQLYVNDTRITIDNNVPSYTSYNFSQWLGVAMDTSFSVNGGKFVGCAHLQANILPLDSDCQKPRATNGKGVHCYRASGICYSLDNLGDDNSRPKIVSRMPSFMELVNDLPVPDEDNKRPGVYHYAFAQWGTSVRLSKEKDYIIMGAPGSFHWRGNVIVQMNHISCALEKIATFRSYFGYSITDVKLVSRPDELIIAGGAPRGSEKGELGQVIIISLTTTEMTEDKCKSDPVTVLQRISFNESVYNYFGGSILAVDVNGDNDDELFVGAPFTNLNMSGGEGDEGAVYCYTYNATGQDLFERTALLHGATKTRESRFGTAIASMGDMNLDGFNDIVIGAPHEDGESGAVYIYLGSRRGITPTPHQRIAASEVASRLPLKSFGYSLGTGRDIDGNAYPDLSVGAFLSDSVAVFRTRPVHDVTAKIWFLAPEIRWQQLNCSKSGDKQEFRTSVHISFFYSVPRKERENTAPFFVLSDYLGRNATLDASSKMIVFEDDASARALQFLAVPCFPNALLQDNSCVSFKSLEPSDSYLRLIDDVVHLAPYDDSDGSYNQSASFRIEGGNLLDYEKLPRLSSVSVGILNRPSYYLQSTGGRELKAYFRGGNSMPIESVFTFTADYNLPCIQDLVYDLHVDHGLVGPHGRRASLAGPNEDAQQAPSVRETISFTSRNLFEPLNRTWIVVFPKYPRNIGLPLTFQVILTGPTFKANVAARNSTDIISLSRLSPVLNRLAKVQFDGEIGFFKECGNDSRCDAVLSTGMTVTSVGGGLIIGSTVDLDMSLTIFNSGEAAISVRLEIVHPSLVIYRQLTMEDACNEVTGLSDSFDASAPGSDNFTSLADDGRAAAYFDVKNQIHTNKSLVFVVTFNTKKVKTEHDFPDDEMEFLIRTGTQGSVENGTDYTSFKIPVRYEGKLDTQGNSEPSMLEFSTDPDSLTELDFEHLYIVSNVGPGLIPSVVIDVLVPQEKRYNIVKSMSVQVNESDSMEKRRLENGTDIKMENLQNKVENQEELDLPSNTNKEKGVIQAVVQLVQGNSQGRTIHMDCKEGRCSRIRRYHFGSMYAGEDVFVKIKITISVTNMTKIEDLETFTFSSYVRARPENISVNVKQWKAGQVNTTVATTKVITVLQNKKTETIPIWVYIVSTLVGLLHLIAIFSIMWKCGFFKRKDYTELKEMAVRESRLPTKTNDSQENDDQDSQYDNDMLLLDDLSHKSASQDSIASSNDNAMEEGSSRIISPAVDELHAKHPGIDFTAE